MEAEINELKQTTSDMTFDDHADSNTYDFTAAKRNHQKAIRPQKGPKRDMHTGEKLTWNGYYLFDENNNEWFSPFLKDVEPPKLVRAYTQ